MNEAETRAEKIDPLLTRSGWGVAEGSRILREYHLTAGRIQTGGGRAKPLIADYILLYRGRKLAVIEAKSDEKEVGEGVMQAKDYASMLHLDYTFSTNGREIYQVCMSSGKEEFVPEFPTPEALWNMTFSDRNAWREKFDQVPFEFSGPANEARYYQEIAVNRVMQAIAEKKQRILLTMATGTGKTFIASQIAWKLFQTRWNLKRDGLRRPRVLFLADRNILADQAFNAFSYFPEDALVRIRPGQIRKKGRVPTNGSIFFTIFQTFMTGEETEPYYFGYPPDFFDLVIIDECHRGGANDESNWRDIMEYFSPAVQIGLTATPRRQENADTYLYFGEPVYVYTLKEGIDDGYLTPFKLRIIDTTLDEYQYAPDDTVVEGEIETGRTYIETDFNRIIEIKAREAKRVKIFLEEVDQSEKSIVFCATQEHAAAIRDLINQYSDNIDPFYCTRVTANDGLLGEQYLREFQDNEKTIPTILTTSQKLSTGVDARNIRNIVFLRPIRSMIEFKQIIGRGTRLFEGKQFFTIYDFVDAHKNFDDEDWGKPDVTIDTPARSRPRRIADEGETGRGNYRTGDDDDDGRRPQKIKVKLRDGKELEIQHTIATEFWGSDGKPISVTEFINHLYGKLPDFYNDEGQLREIWSNPVTRQALLDRLADAGYGLDVLRSLQKMIEAEKSDLFDVLEYVSYQVQPITREIRVAKAQSHIFSRLDDRQKEFLSFVLAKYIEDGVEELSVEKLPKLLNLKYQSITDAIHALGDVERIRSVFDGFQRHLYAGTAG